MGAGNGVDPVDANTKELPAVRDLMRSFANLALIMKIDAMHTQSDTAQAVLARHAGYVMTVGPTYGP